MSYLYCGGSECLRAPLPDLLEVSHDIRSTHFILTVIVTCLPKCFGVKDLFWEWLSFSMPLGAARGSGWLFPGGGAEEAVWDSVLRQNPAGKCCSPLPQSQGEERTHILHSWEGGAHTHCIKMDTQHHSLLFLFQFCGAIFIYFHIHDWVYSFF